MVEFRIVVTIVEARRSTSDVAADPIMPAAHGEDTARSIRGAELLIVPSLGHDFTESAARVYLQAIGNFVAKVEERARVAS